ncbi:Remorin 4.1 [Zea mays]|uniref:Remorin 4.1 n=1 Tax=Zea mays TaxID=4577 RepID=A0A3L6F594_MAIZE|nr:Remorin 4.1 [Zea mays]
MEYERIEKPFPVQQGGGFSPKRLRAMLLGVDKRRKGQDGAAEEDEDGGGGGDYGALPKAHARSGAGDGGCFCFIPSAPGCRLPAASLSSHVGGGATCEEYKDVDVVSTTSEFSSSLETAGGHRPRDAHPVATGSRTRVPPEEDSCDSESVASNFEFHKERRAAAAASVVPPFSKPAPSKWDDAQKWIASPTANCPGRGGAAPAPKKTEKPGSGIGRLPLPATKVVVEATEEIDTKRMDPSQEKREIGWQKAARWAPPDPCPEVEPCPTKTTLLAVETTVAAASAAAVNFNRHDASTTLQSAATCIPPPTTVRSVSMRDMGTEMTPIASQEPSRTGTPVRATSPNCSQPTTPRRTLGGPSAVGSFISHGGECSSSELSEQELQTKTRREIMLLGTQLGKTSIAAWASKKEEEKDASLSLKPVPMDQSTQNITAIRAAAWEEAEKAKYLARFKREEIKIQAWEDHQKAQIEAEMRKIEVEVERMRARAQDKLMTKLASARHSADEKRATAELKRNRAAARTAEQAEHIRRTGRVPPSFGCWNWCS